MRVILDTNILLQAIARASRLRPIWEAFLNERYQLYVTTDVLLEYEEKLLDKTSELVAEAILLLIEKAANAHFIKSYFKWYAITFDFDDNKFFDAAVAANADYLVTNDGHFNSTKALTFPRVNIISADEFLLLL